jgi:hypothetical protein
MIGQMQGRVDWYDAVSRHSNCGLACARISCGCRIVLLRAANVYRRQAHLQNDQRIRAGVPEPQTAHSTLLRRKVQKPIFRFVRDCEPTSHAAAAVSAMAGHWVRSA